MFISSQCVYIISVIFLISDLVQATTSKGALRSTQSQRSEVAFLLGQMGGNSQCDSEENPNRSVCGVPETYLIPANTLNHCASNENTWYCGEETSSPQTCLCQGDVYIGDPGAGAGFEAIFANPYGVYYNVPNEGIECRSQSFGMEPLNGVTRQCFCARIGGSAQRAPVYTWSDDHKQYVQQCGPRCTPYSMDVSLSDPPIMEVGGMPCPSKSDNVDATVSFPNGVAPLGGNQCAPCLDEEPKVSGIDQREQTILSGCMAADSMDSAVCLVLDVFHDVVDWSVDMANDLADTTCDVWDATKGFGEDAWDVATGTIDWAEDIWEDTSKWVDNTVDDVVEVVDDVVEDVEEVVDDVVDCLTPKCSGCSGCSGCGWGGCSGCSGCSDCSC